MVALDSPLVVGFVAMLLALLVGWAVVLVRGSDDGNDQTSGDGRDIVDVVFGDDEDRRDRVKEVVVDDDGAIEHPQPNIQTASFGLVEEFVRFYRRRKKERKLARKGYVKWVLVDSTMSRPKFVKPEAEAGGVPEFEHGDGTYLFPTGGGVPDESTGMRTFIHRVNDAEPVNVQDPLRSSIKADSLKEYLTLRVSSDPPGWLEGMNLDARSLLMYSMGALVLVAVFQRMM